MILVTGAAGKTGRSIIRVLAARGQHVRALARRETQADALSQIGAHEIVAGDLLDEAALARAARGVRAVYHICPNVHPQEVAIGKSIIAAARGAGVRLFAYHSVLHPQTESMPHHWSKLRVEEMLFESGLLYTILQPAPYMQNVLAEKEAIMTQGVYRVPYSVQAPFSLVDLEDVAEAAAIVLTEPVHAGATYELCGPEVLTPSDIAAVWSAKLGRSVQAQLIAVEDWARRAKAAGLSEYAVDTLTRMFGYYDRYGLWGNSRVLSDLLGRPPARFEAFVERTIHDPTIDETGI
ncbi:MAG TPA: NmrA/HSCARG family protein [Anaerolineae bacterium]|nr:NmrA/HSCARG family protein [Anaerolineae bacterium]